MFDMIGVAPICVRADQKVQVSIFEHLTLPDNLCRTSGPIEVLDKIFAPILGRGKSELNRAKNPVVWARLKADDTRDNFLSNVGHFPIENG